MSCGFGPGHSVKTICWFSPMSGIASTGTGSRGRPAEVPVEGRDEHAPEDRADEQDRDDELLLQTEPDQRN
jgi:hypothetical protein